MYMCSSMMIKVETKYFFKKKSILYIVIKLQVGFYASDKILSVSAWMKKENEESGGTGNPSVRELINFFTLSSEWDSKLYYKSIDLSLAPL